MKKVFLILAAVFVTTLFANAQINFGIKAGYNSSLTLDNISLVKSGTYNLNSVAGELANGFHGGVFMRLGLGKKLYVQPELLYGMQKKEYTLTIDDAVNQDITVDKFVNFSTVDVPVLVGYKIVDGKIANLRVFAGPKFRLNAGSTLDFKNLTSGAALNESELSGEFKKSTVGLEAGAGIDVLMFTLDARLNLINDIYQAKWQSKPDLNSNFIVSLGFKF